MSVERSEENTLPSWWRCVCVYAGAGYLTGMSAVFDISRQLRAARISVRRTFEFFLFLHFEISLTLRGSHESQGQR